MSVTIKYFAWLRERVGKAEEDMILPAGVNTLTELIAHLRRQGEEYDHAFATDGVIRAALDKRHVPLDAAIGGAREIAFFPPMTGG
ncbi:MAG: molybdopterin converting factor subunit 1 [Hyphomicrobiales bacterium]|nr:molybdopterin converting factor subunit 1 [Hyphomicrobiales bacterium]OQW84908.1 MAG: molybdopterin converting factor subunit 1 [Proteobacteria bacterium ST_bin15]